MDEDEIERYDCIEFTVGVCVTMSFDGEKYVVDSLTHTAGGLFSDAEEGFWAPSVQDWVNPTDSVECDAQVEAWLTVKKAIGEVK